MSVAERKFMHELVSLLDTTVSVRTTDGRVITGRLVGFEPRTLSICLWNARVEGGEGAGAEMPKLFLNGSAIMELWSAERPFDLRGLRDRIARAFGGYEHVRLLEDERVIIVAGRVKVSREGVEGTGPLAERVRRIYEEFVKEWKAKQEKKEKG